MYNEKNLNENIEMGILGSYLWMGLGLLITFGIMYSSLYSVKLVNISIMIQRFSIILMIAIAVLIRYIVVNSSASVLKLVFIGYSAFLGILLIPIMYAYQMVSIITLLGSTSAMFVGMSAYGYFTRSNLQSYSKYLFGGLLGIIVMSVLNIYIFKSNTGDIMLSMTGLLIFIIYTAVDTQRIKSMILDAYYEGNKDLLDKVKIFGALMLYSDFINMFLYLLSLFGKRRD
ncbi:Bax inhibitor-1/YccA family protein [Streptobacillus moniliformis]|uniref:Bax inhibitor-1/YccA family protein n=1 Tax=Streptobacillus moniliformis TaxID=34105 RepID=UPI0007E3FB7C|nr:Bax inhibitor-1/YccA family protein [Streptobacillus moniliformis]QXW65686.1 Bax inhibitor-1/YccA family protein [Streptobacillus moniliformis]